MSASKELVFSCSINLLAIRRQVLDQLRGPLTSHPSTLPPMPRWKPQKRYRHTTNIDHLDLVRGNIVIILLYTALNCTCNCTVVVL